jgi:hypothetical protein
VRRERGHAPARLNADCRLNVLVEPVEHRHKAIDGEAGKLRLPNARKIRRRKACEFMSAANGQFLIVEDADDLGGEDRLELFNFGVGITLTLAYLPKWSVVARQPASRAAAAINSGQAAAPANPGGS